MGGGILDSIDTEHIRLLRLIDCVDTVNEEHVEGMKEERGHEHEEEEEHEHEHGEEEHETHETRPRMNMYGRLQRMPLQLWSRLQMFWVSWIRSRRQFMKRTKKRM